ncbi:MAG: hypothetical protein WCS95_04180 [Lentisphaeria bacterium]|nr:hypothetical protein [Lentisphaerota bacterium]
MRLKRKADFDKKFRVDSLLTAGGNESFLPGFNNRRRLCVLYCVAPRFYHLFLLYDMAHIFRPGFFVLIMLVFSHSFMHAQEPLCQLSLQGWQSRSWHAEGKAKLSALKAEQTLPLPISLPGRQEYVQSKLDKPELWQKAEELRLSFKVPENLPDSARLIVFTRDKDFLWRQYRCDFAATQEDRLELRLPLRHRQAEELWEPRGHRQAWNCLSTKLLLEYGFAIEAESGSEDEFEGSLELLSASLWQLPEPSGQAPVYDLAFTPRRPQLGQGMQFSFKLNRWPLDPFNPASANIKAEISLPDGTRESLRAFYYEGFIYDPAQWDLTSCLEPYGKPEWQLRYTPRQEGNYKVRIHAEVDGKNWELPELSFSCRGGRQAWRGYVRCDDENKAFLRYDDGSPFWGLGVNLRSPFDNRYKQVAPYSQWQDMGLAAYDYLLPKYKQYGINVIELWMSSWWLALEWINDAPGFHGVGHYNQQRAWMLDHIMRLAEENDIHLILVINNHGKFGTTYDTEWARNPYNVVNGGFLENCEDFYTSEQAKQAFRQSMDYIVARWGASPNLLTWKLFTEVDLTGNSIEFYHHPSVAAWHAEMGKYIKEIDPWQHPVTTHWMLGYHRINDAIAKLPELDWLTTDAYYNPGAGSKALVNMLKTGVQYGEKWEKPLGITEFGGSSYADSMGNLVKQVEIGLWTGLFNSAGLLPMYWWFALLEDKQLYDNYLAISRFAAKIDRRKLRSRENRLPDTALSLNEMLGEERYYAWIFDEDYYYSDVENLKAARHLGQKIEIESLPPGEYKLQIMNPRNAEIIEERKLVLDDAALPLLLTLPEFQRSIALKIEKRD